MPTRILLVGAGSIGAFFGSRLATVPNVLVSALCRSNYDAVKEKGFHISSTQYGETTFYPERTFQSGEEIRRAQLRFDFVVVATKALPDVGDDSALLEGIVAREEDATSIVLIQNGIGIEQPFRKRFPQASILTATTIASCAQPSPGFIKHNRWTKTSIGPYLSPADSASDDSQQRQQQEAKAAARTETFVSLLKQAGIKDAESHDHQSMQFVRWHKLAINAAMNASAVLSAGAGNRELALDPELAIHAKGVMDEVLTTASHVLGNPVPLKELGLAAPDQILASVKKNTTGSRPSMWHDWENGRKMELEVILGNPIRMGREVGCEMPRLQSMYALLKKAQQTREKDRESSKL